MDEVFFSIIVPVYNVAEYLRDCLDSIVHQQSNNFEVLLINDGSTDDSERICREYINEYPFIRYFFKKNGGLSSARNFGIRVAKGKYLLFVDSDDVMIGEDFLNRMYSAINNVIVDFVMYLPIEYDSGLDKIVRLHNACTSPLYQLIDSRSIIDSLYSVDGPYITMAQTKIVRREYLLNNGLFFMDGIFHEDDEWIVRVLLKYPTVLLTDVVGYGYRHREGSIISSTDDSRMLKKRCDKIDISDRALATANIYNHKDCLTYFLYYYSQAFAHLRKKSVNTKRLLEKANKVNVINAMRYSKSRMHRCLYVYGKLFGVRAANRLLLFVMNCQRG